MRSRVLLSTLVLAAVTAFGVSAAVASIQAQTETEEESVGNLLYVLSNSSPHVTVIDTATDEIVETADLEDFTSWTWNDDNNYFDGENLWLGLKDPDTNEAEVIALNLDTFEIAARLPVGVDELTLYIGKATQDGILHVGKMASGEVVVIDTKEMEILDTWTGVPVNGDVVCDADVTTGEDGVERFYYPTRGGDTVVSLNAETGEVDTVIDSPTGSVPLMLTTAPDGSVWVQERDANSNAVYDPVTLELVGRFLTGKAPIVASFSADGKFGYIGHGDDTIVQVVDAETLEEIARVEVGINPQKLAVHPDGASVYAILTKEASVAVIDTETWEVTGKIDLGTNPTGIFLRPAPIEEESGDD